jgi:hypothetical protein
MPKKKRAMTIKVAVTYGMSSRFLWRFWARTIVEKTVRIKVQNKSEPFCPPHSAATVYCTGRVELEYEETYSTLKSWVRSACNKATTAISTQPNTAYVAFVPLAIHISRRETAPHTLMQIA